MSDNLTGRLARRLTRAIFHTGGLRLASGKPKDYESVFDSVIKRIPQLRAEVARNQELAERRFLELVRSPKGRQETVIRNSPPSSLVALAYRMMEQSYDDRYSDVERSLVLAQLATRLAREASKTDYLSEHSADDLVGESLLHLANALRLNSQTVAAQRTLEEAEALLWRGTRDRYLRAKLLSFKGSLLVRQRRLAEAASAFGREIEVRKALGEPEKLGAALINRGAVACHANRLTDASVWLREGTLLVDDNRARLVAMTNFAEALARDEHGAEAWQAACTAETIAVLLQTSAFSCWISWCKGLAYLALDRPRAAVRELEEARAALESGHRASSVAAVSIDLCCALAELGRYHQMKPLISDAFTIFSSERIDQRVLEVLILFRGAVESQRVTADFAKKVANFVARSRYDRNLRFEHPLP